MEQRRGAAGEAPPPRLSVMVSNETCQLETGSLRGGTGPGFKRAQRNVSETSEFK